jgi:hypothetical protein
MGPVCSTHDLRLLIAPCKLTKYLLLQMANGDSSNMIEAVMASSRAGSLGEVILL